MAELGLNFDELLQQEEEPGLGNGGLGRLAACFIDSLATLEVPALGYGIRYEFGIFHQEIVDGWQVEKTDNWLRFGNPWELVRPEWAVERQIRRQHRAVHRRARARCACAGCPHKIVIGVPYDTPILGYRTNTANTLRLWRAEAPESFDFASVQQRRLLRRRQPEGHLGEPQQGALSERRAAARQGTAARAAVFLRLLLAAGHVAHPAHAEAARCAKFHEKFAVQLNDTHPAIAIAELMRLLVDEHALPWDEAWERHPQDLRLYQPHAAAGGPGALAARGVRPRVAAPPARSSTRSTRISSRRCACASSATRSASARMSLIDESGERYVRMAHLACVGSHAINGVAELHTELLKTRRAEGLLRAVAAQVQQQDQRRDAAALDGAQQSAARRT